MYMQRLFNLFNIVLLTFAVVSTSAFKNNYFIISNSQLIIAAMIFCFFSMSFFIGKLKVEQLLFFLLLIIVSLIVTYQSRSSKMLLLLLYSLSCRCLSLKDAFIDVFIAKLLTLCSTLLFFFYGIVNDLNNGEFGRHSFGFGHPNSLGATIFVIEICLATYIVVKNKKALSKSVVILISQIPFLYLLYSSGSSGAEFGTAISFIIMIYFLFRNNINYSVVLKMVAYGTIIGIPLISIFMLNNSVIYTGSFLNRLNTLLSNRLFLSYSFFKEYGISFFGQKINYNFNLSAIYSYAFLDNAYVELLINYGIISLLAVITYNFLVLKKSIKFSLPWLSILIISMCLYGFVEQGFDQYWVNPIFSMTGLLFYNPIKKEKTIES